MQEKMIGNKVRAYIIHRGRLLVFRYVDFPVPGIHVPGGTAAAGEPLEAAVLREAREETGLANLKLVAKLGTRRVSVGEQGWLRRHFFQLALDDSADPPQRWRCAEMDPSDGSPAPIWFELYWVSLQDGLPELAFGQGALLDRLLPAGRGPAGN